MRWAVIVVAACSSSAPVATTSPSKPSAPAAPVDTSSKDAPIANVAPPPPAPAPAPAPTTAGTPIARPCSRQSPIVFTVASDTKIHEQLCGIVDDYIMFLGTPPLRAPDLALQLTATITEGSFLECKVSIDVHLRTKLVMTVDGGAKLAVSATDDITKVREDCMRAIVNDQLGRQIVPALVRAGVTGPSNTGSGTGSASP